jgi:hypothetical protein
MKGIDPIECARMLSGVRNCSFYVCDENKPGKVVSLNLNAQFFEQFPDPGQQVLDVIACSWL